MRLMLASLGNCLHSLIPRHNKFELLGVDVTVAVPVENLERLADLGSLQNGTKR